MIFEKAAQRADRTGTSLFFVLLLFHMLHVMAGASAAIKDARVFKTAGMDQNGRAGQQKTQTLVIPWNHLITIALIVSNPISKEKFYEVSLIFLLLRYMQLNF